MITFIVKSKYISFSMITPFFLYLMCAKIQTFSHYSKKATNFSIKDLDYTRFTTATHRNKPQL